MVQNINEGNLDMASLITISSTLILAADWSIFLVYMTVLQDYKPNTFIAVLTLLFINCQC